MVSALFGTKATAVACNPDMKRSANEKYVCNCAFSSMIEDNNLTTKSKNNSQRSFSVVEAKRKGIYLEPVF